MRQTLFVLVVALLATCSVWAATGADFDLVVQPASTAFRGAPNSIASGSASVAVMFTSRVDAVQGWSFAVRAGGDAGVTTIITSVVSGAGTLTAKNGGVPDFNKTAWYAADSTSEECAGAVGCPFEDGELVEAVAASQAVVVDFMAAVTLSAFTGLELLNLGVSVSGQVGDVDGDGNPVGPPICGRLFFADDVGTPAVASVAVVGGASIVPAVLSGAEFCLSAFQPACAPPAQFTINVGSGSGGTGAVINVPVVLNFNSDPANPNTGAVQGWSYGLCASGPVEITAAVLGADAAVVKNGAAPGFDTISIFPGQGVTHGLVIDMMAAVTLPAADATAFEDLILTLELGVNEFDPVAGISPCDRALGTPRTANVMVIGGASIAAQKYEGSLADRETETGCCDPAACNTPGEYTLSLGDIVVAGSVNGDGRMDIADAVYLLSALFRGGPAVLCEKAADVNGDCTLDASDAIWIINYLFLDGPAPVQGLGCVLVESDVCPNLTCEVSECK